jgi:hypothetical protein
MDALSGRTVPDGEEWRPETYMLLLTEDKPKSKDELVLNGAEVL